MNKVPFEVYSLIIEY